MIGSRGIIHVVLLPLALAAVAFLVSGVARFAYADTASSTATGTVSVVPEKLEKDLKSFIGKGIDRQDK